MELGPTEEDKPRGDWPYREAVGPLMWLSNMTRPDISNAVRAVACHSQPLRQALERSYEDNGNPSRDLGFGIDVCEGFGIGIDCVW